MQYVQSLGALETIALVIFVSVGLVLRQWLIRAERDGRLDRSRWVFRRGAVADARGVWAAPHRRSMAERNQPEQELPPLPFRDQPPPDDHSMSASLPDAAPRPDEERVAKPALNHETYQ